MKNELNRILRDYTSGEQTLEEANAALEAVGASFRLDPEKNTIHPGEEQDFGLLDTGTGSLDKVRIRDGKLLSCDCGRMPARVYFLGRCFEVRGDSLDL